MPCWTKVETSTWEEFEGDAQLSVQGTTERAVYVLGRICADMEERFTWQSEALQVG